MSLRSLGFDARYSAGINDIAHRANLADLVLVGDPQPMAYRNRGFTFLGSYRF